MVLRVLAGIFMKCELLTGTFIGNFDQISNITFTHGCFLVETKGSACCQSTVLGAELSVPVFLVTQAIDHCFGYSYIIDLL